jgi:hypothetical protein
MNLPDPNKANGVLPVSPRTGRVRFMPKDSRGVVLRVGQHVAFNRSGHIATGIVEHVGTAVKIYRDPEFQSKYHASKHSRVHNYRSILVLEAAS